MFRIATAIRRELAGDEAGDCSHAENSGSTHMCSGEEEHCGAS
jgi:hypothetical protein